MNKVKVLICIVALFAFACSPSQEEKKNEPVDSSASTQELATKEFPAGSLFIIGGGKRPEAMIERIAKESGLTEGGYGIVLPMSSEEPDTAIHYGTKQFHEIGIEAVYGLEFLKDEVLAAAKVDSVRNAKLIYISGGDQNKFMGVVRGTEIEKAIHEAYQNGSMIAGTSAGAAVMSEIMITGNELKHPDYSSTFRNIEADNIETDRGLGMVKSVIIDQHFVKRSRHNRLLSAVIEYPDKKCVGIDESTAIFIKNGNAEVVGESQVLVFSNPQKDKKVQGDLLGAKDLNISIFLPGESFEILE